MNIMKTKILKLESLFVTIVLILVSLNAASQDNRISRQEKKEARRDRQYLNFQAVDSMLQSKSFVLEADFLENQYGNRIPVLSNLNFIIVDSTRAVLQTGSSTGAGTNGVGGATAEGSLQGMKIVKDNKNLNFSLRFTVVTNIGVYDVSMTINSSSYARATITGLTRGKLIYSGRIVTAYNSSAYKGRNSI